MNVLNKVQLLVRARCPEVLARVRELFVDKFAVLAGSSLKRRFFAKRRVGEHVVEAHTRVGKKRIISCDGRNVVEVTDVVQEKVHEAKSARGGNDLPAVECLVLQELLLVGVELIGFLYVALRGQQEATRTATRVTDGFLRLRLHAFDDGVDERPGRKVLPGTRFGVLGYSLK